MIKGTRADEISNARVWREGKRIRTPSRWTKDLEKDVPANRVLAEYVRRGESRTRVPPLGNTVSGDRTAHQLYNQLDNRFLQRRSQQRYCIVSRRDEDPPPSRLSLQSLFWKTLVKKFISKRVYKKGSPMLVRSLPIRVNRCIRPEGITTHKKHKRYRKVARGSR